MLLLEINIGAIVLYCTSNAAYHSHYRFIFDHHATRSIKSIVFCSRTIFSAGMRRSKVKIELLHLKLNRPTLNDVTSFIVVLCVWNYFLSFQSYSWELWIKFCAFHISLYFSRVITHCRFNINTWIMNNVDKHVIQVSLFERETRKSSNNFQFIRPVHSVRRSTSVIINLLKINTSRAIIDFVVNMLSMRDECRIFALNVH